MHLHLNKTGIGEGPLAFIITGRFYGDDDDQSYLVFAEDTEAASATFCAELRSTKNYNLDENDEAEDPEDGPGAIYITGTEQIGTLMPDLPAPDHRALLKQAIEAGASVTDFLLVVNEVKPPSDFECALIEKARNLYVEEGAWEIDEPTTASIGDENGGYVLCWRWVDGEGLEYCNDLDDEEEED